VAMKAAEADQTARWFAPQIEELRKDLEVSRQALEAFQAETNMVAPNEGGDSETSQYMAISAQLVAAKAQLNTLQSRLSSGSTDLSNDSSDPDLQLVAGLKEKLLSSQVSIEAAKGLVGANNPKMMSEQASVTSVRKQLADASDKMRQHLKERIATTQEQIGSLQTEQAQAQKSLIGVQGQRERLIQLQHDVAFRADQLNARERAAEQAKLESKLTFSNMTILDKATPPLDPAFPKPRIAIPVGIGAGLALGLLLALLAEATDRRVRFPIDLEYAASAPFLGGLEGVPRSRTWRLAWRPWIGVTR
jgi:succinoglycan biosynthesis transport protein ExoP